MSELDWLLRDADWVHLLTIPLFTGVVGWLINWSGLWMLFSPLRFHGIRVPGMRELGLALLLQEREVLLIREHATATAARDLAQDPRLLQPP